MVKPEWKSTRELQDAWDRLNDKHKRHNKKIDDRNKLALWPQNTLETAVKRSFDEELDEQETKRQRQMDDASELVNNFTIDNNLLSHDKGLEILHEIRERVGMDTEDNDAKEMEYNLFEAFQYQSYIAYRMLPYDSIIINGNGYQPDYTRPLTVFPPDFPMNKITNFMLDEMFCEIK